MDKILFARSSNHTVAFGLTGQGNSLVLGSGKTHVTLEPNQKILKNITPKIIQKKKE